MEIESWIIAQVVIDALIAISLVFIFLLGAKRKSIARSQETILKSEKLLQEMQQIATNLNSLLEEKKRLVDDLLTGLDNEIKKAEMVFGEIKQVNSSLVRNTEPPQTGSAGKKQIPIKTIKRLAKKGMSKEEISKCLDLPSGEVELILKLAPLTPKATSSRRT